MKFKKEPLTNKFDQIVAASIRARELKRGQRPLIAQKGRDVVVAMAEVEQGKIGSEYLLKVK